MKHLLLFEQLNNDVDEAAVEWEYLIRLNQMGYYMSPADFMKKYNIGDIEIDEFNDICDELFNEMSDREFFNYYDTYKKI